MARESERYIMKSIISGIFFMKVLIFICLWISCFQSSAVAENNLNAKESALTVVESSDQDNEEGDDGVVSIESNQNGVEDGPGDELTDEVFEPTKEWKTVKKGQSVPPGLNIRLNLQTGEREAKLMDKDDAMGTKRWDGGENIGFINTEKKRFTPDEIKKVVKDFKIKDMDSKQAEDKEDVRKKYRSYDELKQVMKDMEMAVKTESEIMIELLTILKQPGVKSEDVKTLLVDVEYYLHQFDNARLFCDKGGMETLLKLMNNTDDDIRAKAVHALGAAVQSNGKVQVEAIEYGVLQQLLKILSVDTSFIVRKKSLFALSALLRQFPYAQKKFLTSGGLSALSELFLNSIDESLKVKIITLLTDFVQEHHLNALQPPSGDKIQEERSRQYMDVKIGKAMQAEGWCAHLTTLLAELTEHDDIEKTLSAMSITQDICKNEFSSARPRLEALSSIYNNLAKEDDDPDSYFISIYKAVDALLNKNIITKDEL